MQHTNLSVDKPSSTESSVISNIYSNGYFVEHSLLKPEIISKVTEALPKLIDEDLERFSNNPYYKDHQIAMNLMFRGEIFRQVMTTPRLIEIVDAIMGNTSILNAYNAPCTPGGGTNSARVIHTDCPPERCIPGCITNLNLVIAISPFTAAAGATFYLPNSQELTSAPAEEKFYANAVQVELMPGDVVFFNAHLWHAAGINQTAQIRYGLGMNFVKSYMRQRFDYPRMAPAELESKLTKLERRLLGFDVRVPTSLDEFYVSPDKRLYQANQG